jgi:hypothetical protein
MVQPFTEFDFGATGMTTLLCGSTAHLQNLFGTRFSYLVMRLTEPFFLQIHLLDALHKNPLVPMHSDQIRTGL